MFKKILVPLDSSELAEHALEPAIKLAQNTQAELTLFHVLERHTIIIPDGPEMMGQSLYYPESTMAHEEEKVRAYLNELCNEVGQTATDVTIKIRLEEGDPASAIVDLAENEPVDLIVMSTHGYSGFTRWLLGSVAEKVMRHVDCPVLVVRYNKPISRLLITLDGSSLAESSLPFGFEVAQAFKADVDLLLVDEDSDQVDQDMVADLTMGLKVSS